MFQTEVVEKIKTNIFCTLTFFEIRTVYEKMWKYSVQGDRTQMTIWRTRIACTIPNTKNTHTQVVKYSLFFRCNIGCTNAPLC